MTRLTSWDEFAEKADDLYSRDPAKCRMTMKYRHSDNKLDVKVTNNARVYQYSAQQSDIDNVNRLSNKIMNNMTRSSANK